MKFREGKKPGVTAVDEDGNTVSVEIAEDGKLKVNPDNVTDKDGKTVAFDDPITVTITDDNGNETTVVSTSPARTAPSTLRVRTTTVRRTVATLVPRSPASPTTRRIAASPQVLASVSRCWH